MNRKNVDNIRFVDFDELTLMAIVPFTFINDGNQATPGFRVDGLLKNGVSVEGLFVDKQSGQDKLCTNFIMNNWVNARK